jgi:hypothetical protein
MGSSVLKGISTALLITVLTLFAGIVWDAGGPGGLSVSLLVDIGLMASCLVGGFRTGKESGQWLLGGVVGAGYVTVGSILLALFLPVQGWGYIKVLVEGVIIGLVAGAVGAGVTDRVVSGAWQGRRSLLHSSPLYAGYDDDERVSYKSDWNDQEEFGENGNRSSLNWIEGSELEIQGNRRTKWDFEEGADVEWSWDGEEDKELLSSGTGNAESLVEWEPDRVNADTIGWNRTDLGNASVNKARPWWEE